MLSQNIFTLITKIFGSLIFIVNLLSFIDISLANYLYPVEESYEFNYLKREFGILELSQFLLLVCLLYYLLIDYKTNLQKKGFQKFWLIAMTFIIPFIALEETDYFLNFYDLIFKERGHLFGFRNFHNSNHFWFDIFIYFIVALNIYLIYKTLKIKDDLFSLNYKAFYFIAFFLHLSLIIQGYLTNDTTNFNLIMEHVDSYKSIQIFTETSELSMYLWWILMYFDQRDIYN